MLRETNAHVLVYQALDQVLTDQVVSSGTHRAIYRAIDVMRTSLATPERVRRAEDIAVEIHKLQWALQQSDQHGRQAALQKLRQFAGAWVDARVRS
jgi:hypothetical protein